METKNNMESNGLLLNGFFVVTVKFEMSNYSKYEVAYYIHLPNAITFAQMMKDKFINDLLESEELGEEVSFIDNNNIHHYHGVSKNGKNFVTINVDNSNFKDLSVQCISCDSKQEINLKSIYKDDLGHFTVCKMCDSSFDIW